MSSAAELVVNIRASGVASTIGGLDRVDAKGRSTAASVKASMRQIAGPLGIASVGVAAVAAGREVIGFDKAMRNVNSIARLKGPQYRELAKSINLLGGKTAQAPTSLANGLYDLVSSGFDANESLTILNASSVAATAGLTDTGTATKAVAAVLNAYHRPASDAAQVSDDLFQTVNRGVLSFGDLAQNIGDVLPFASSLHVGLKQVGAATATMTKAGVSAPETMTRIKGVMAALIKPTDELKGAYKELGVSSGSDLVRKFGSLQGGLQAVTRSVGGNKEAISKLFPDIRGLGGVLLLTGKNAKSAGEDLGGMANSSGQAQRTFNEQSKSISFQFDKLKSTISSALNQNVDTTGIASALGAVTSALDVITSKDNKGDGGPLDGVVGAAKDLVNLNWDGVKLGVSKTKYLLDGLDKLLGGGPKSKEVKVSVKVKDETANVLNNVANKKTKNLIVKILGNKSDVDTKARQIEALGISGPTARFIAELGSVNAARAAITAPITVPVTYLPNVVRPSLPGGLPRSGNFGPLSGGLGELRRAAGRGPGRAETALVGEGNGPEWVGNPRAGWSLIAGPQIMGLGVGDYVIPTEGRYRGEWSDIAKAFGLPGFKKGKGPSKKELARRGRVDQRIENAGTSAGTYQAQQEIAQDNSAPTGFSRAKRNRLNALRLQRKRILSELRRAKGSRRITLLNQLAQVNRELQTTGDSAYEAPTVESIGKGGDVPYSRGSTYADNFGKVDPFAKDLAMAGLTKDTTDDKAVLERKKRYLQGALGSAIARGDDGAVTAVASALKDTTDSLDALSSSVEENTAAQQAQLELARQQLEQTTKALNTSQAELRAFGKYVVGVVSGQVGQTVGRAASTPVPGRMGSY